MEIINTIKNSELEYLEQFKFLYPKPSPIIALYENENILNFNEPIKFFSFKQNYSIKFIKLEIDPFSIFRNFIKFQSINFLFFINTLYAEHKIESDIASMTSFLYKKEERSEIRKSKKNHIIIGKNNYNKRNKLKKMNIIKIRNIPKNFKNKFR